jgi:RNA polymerase sigma factor (sigma-70 family)
MTNREMVSSFLDKNLRYLYWLAIKNLEKIRPGFSTDGEELHEMANDIAAYALGKADDYKPSRGAVQTWLFWQARAVLSRQAYHRVHSVDAQYQRVLDTDCARDLFHHKLSSIPEPVQIVADEDQIEETRARVRTEVDRLPPQTREAVTEVFLNGTPVPEYAGRKRVQQQVVKRMVRRGLGWMSRSDSLCSLIDAE